MAAKKKTAPVNPLTGTSEANTYTQVTNRTLDPPKSVQKFAMTPYDERVKARSRRQYLNYVRNREGRVLKDVPGYGEVDMDALGWSNTPLDSEGNPGKPILDPWFFQRVMGPQRPSTVEDGPAINEPHEVDKHTPVIRRAEDLTGAEYQKGVDALALGGVTPGDVKKEIRNSVDRANMRAILAGETKMAGEGFYGGDTPPNRMIESATQRVLDHPSNRITDPKDARAAAVAAVSATSPKNKVELVKKDGTVINPNQIAADTGIEAGLDQRKITEYPPQGGIRKHMDLAAKRVDQIASGYPMYTDFKGIKTTAFAGAQFYHSGPDSYRVSDVHSTRSGLPHTSSTKSRSMIVIDGQGQPVTQGAKNDPIIHNFYPEDLASDGLPRPKVAAARLAPVGEGLSYTFKTKNGKALKGGSLGEDVLRRGDLPVHAIKDRASREVAADLGWTKSVDHAQAQNQIQEIDWRDQQILRPDLPYSQDTEYPGWRSKMGAPKPGKGTFDDPGEDDTLADWLQQAAQSRSSAFQQGSAG